MKAGDEVVCVSAHRHSIKGYVLQPGQVYVVRDNNNCNCSALLDVGFDSEVETLCPRCGTTIPGKVWWLFAHRFVPLDDIDVSELAEVLELECLPA